MFYFKNTTREIIEEYRNKKEICMFKYANGDVFSADAFVMKTFQIEGDNNDIVAFSTITFEDEQITIDEFEVLESLRRKGIGKNIICQIQSEFDKIELYPDNLETKIFWERCGFVSAYEDGGAIIMCWSKA